MCVAWGKILCFYVRTVYVKILFTPQSALWAEIYDHNPANTRKEIAAGVDIDAISSRGIFIYYFFIVLFAKDRIIKGIRMRTVWEKGRES